MSKRERLEDLGRIREMLHHALDMDLWTTFSGLRTKDREDAFMGLDEKDQREIIHKLMYQREDCEAKLCEILSVARGDDEE